MKEGDDEIDLRKVSQTYSSNTHLKKEKSKNSEFSKKVPPIPTLEKVEEDENKESKPSTHRSHDRNGPSIPTPRTKEVQGSADVKKIKSKEKESKEKRNEVSASNSKSKSKSKSEEANVEKNEYKSIYIGEVIPGENNSKSISIKGRLFLSISE